MKHFHTFGCPVFALKSNLTSNKKIPTWHSCSRLGISLGPSPRHARSCTLALDPNTGLASPPFHASCDEYFETTRRTARNNVVASSNWQKLAGSQDNTTSHERGTSSSNSTMHPTFSHTPPTPALRSRSLREEDVDGVMETKINQDTTAASPNIESTRETANVEAETNNIRAAESPSLRRSTRTRRPTERFIETYDAFMTSLDDPSSYYDALHQDDYKIQDEMMNSVAFLAKTDEDTMYYHQAMKAHDKVEFLKAMVKEFNDYATRGHWEIVHQDDVPSGTKILDSVWSMKRKRDILKWKATLNVHGGQQEHGVNYFETSSPVVHWFSVRLLYIIAFLNKWHTRQIDFVLAYPQADIECEMYMKMPLGLKVPGASRNTYALKLKKNIYRKKQAGRVWYKHLCQGLE